MALTAISSIRLLLLEEEKKARISDVVFGRRVRAIATRSVNVAAGIVTHVGPMAVSLAKGLIIYNELEMEYDPTVNSVRPIFGPGV